jgi:hypothetical protein
MTAGGLIGWVYSPTVIYLAIRRLVGEYTDPTF